MTESELSKVASLVKVQHKAQRRYSAAKTIAIAACVLVIIVGGTLLLVLQLQSRSIASGVASCITPGGDCYERGEDRDRQVEDMAVKVDQLLAVMCEKNPVPACTTTP